jgi:RNA polymerase sigma factor (sigma-70 family)
MTRSAVAVDPEVPVKQIAGVMAYPYMHSGHVADAELLQQAGTDASAFRTLYDRHSPGLYRYFLRRTANAEDSLDLCAETFAQAWLSRDRFEDRCGGDIGPWLFGIARRVFFRSARSRRIESNARRRLEVSVAADRIDAPASDTWVEETEDELHVRLDSLPDSQRHAVTRRYLEDADYEDIAGELGISNTAARIRTSRGVHSIRRQHIEQEEHTP